MTVSPPLITTFGGSHPTTECTATLRLATLRMRGDVHHGTGGTRRDEARAAVLVLLSLRCLFAVCKPANSGDKRVAHLQRKRECSSRLVVERVRHVFVVAEVIRKDADEFNRLFASRPEGLEDEGNEGAVECHCVRLVLVTLPFLLVLCILTSG
jgi:hypothetical protein